MQQRRLEKVARSDKFMCLPGERGSASPSSYMLSGQASALPSKVNPVTSKGPLPPNTHRAMSQEGKPGKDSWSCPKPSLARCPEAPGWGRVVERPERLSGGQCTGPLPSA